MEAKDYNFFVDRLTTIRDEVHKMKYGECLTIHPSDRDFFNKSVAAVDDSAREMAVMLTRLLLNEKVEGGEN